MDLLEQYRTERDKLLIFLLSGKSVQILPGGETSLDDLDTDQISVEYILDCANKGVPVDLSEAIRSYHEIFDIPSLASKSSNIYNPNPENNFGKERGGNENCKIKYMSRRKLKSGRFSSISRKTMQNDMNCIEDRRALTGNRCYNEILRRGLQYDDLRMKDLTSLYKKKHKIPQNEGLKINNLETEIKYLNNNNKVSWDDLRTVCRARGLQANGKIPEMTLALLHSYEKEDEGQQLVEPVKVKKRSRRLHYVDLPREDLITLCKFPDPTLGRIKIAETELHKMSQSEMAEYLGGSKQIVTWNDLRKLCRSHRLKANIKSEGLTKELIKFYNESEMAEYLGGSKQIVMWNDLRKLCRSHRLKANIKSEGLTKELIKFYNEGGRSVDLRDVDAIMW